MCQLKRTLRVIKLLINYLFSTEFADYDPIDDTVVFTNNNKTYCVTVNVKDDSIDEDTETFLVNVQVLGYSDSVSATANISIIDDGELLSALV